MKKKLIQISNDLDDTIQKLEKIEGLTSSNWLTKMLSIPNQTNSAGQKWLYRRMNLSTLYTNKTSANILNQSIQLKKKDQLKSLASFILSIKVPQTDFAIKMLKENRLKDDTVDNQSQITSCLKSSQVKYIDN